MKIFVGLLILVWPMMKAFAGSLFPAPAVQECVGQIHSRMNDDSVSFYGSGFVFAKINGETYVVTSDHVVLHDNLRARHSFYGGRYSGEEPLTYVASDFGRGLALMKFEDRDDFMVEYCTDQDWVFPKKLSPNTGISMTGYPLGSRDLIHNTTGVLAAQGGDNPFLQIPSLLKVIGGYAEFGMSGGAASDSKNEFVGLLSFQKYEQSPSGITNSILVIPAAFIRNWVNGVLNGSISINFTQDLDAQIFPDKKRIYSGQVQFEYQDQSWVLSLTDGPKSILFSQSPELQTAEAYLIAHPTCQILVPGFASNSSGQKTQALSGDFNQDLKKLGDPKLKMILQFSCPHR